MKFLKLILFLILTSCSPKIYYKADIYLVNDDKIAYIWNDAIVMRQDKDFLYFIQNNTTHYVSGNLVIKPL